MAEVKVGGIWLHSLGHVADVKWSTRWGTGPCGPDLASCTLAVDPSNETDLTRVGKSLEVWSGGVKVFGGVVSEMGRDFPRTVAARGWARRGEDFDAVAAGGNPTSNPREAITWAIANGLPWQGDGSGFTDAPLGGVEPNVRRLNDLLTEWATLTAVRWGVDVNGYPFSATDPTTPSYYLDASDLPIGVADDGLYTRVRARYVTSVDAATGQPNGWASVRSEDTPGQAEYGVIEYPMDLTPLGVLDGGTAGGYANAQRDLLTKPQWLSRVTTTTGRLLTPGGLPAHLASVKAGELVRLFNVPHTLGGLRGELGLDVVLGEVEYADATPDEITLAPVNLAVRNLADALARAAKAAA